MRKRLLAYSKLKFVTLDHVDSTNAEAKRLAKTGEKGPLWVRANHQTKGRGRRGREWVSKTGNLYCSGLYPHKGTLQEAAQMSFVAALAVAECLEGYIPKTKIKLKWPNDVLVDAKKTSGILLEGGDGWFVVGIGINLTSHPQETDFPATHLLEHIDPVKLNVAEPIITGPDTVLASLAARFDHWRHIALDKGFDPISEAWLSRAYNIPGRVTVNLHKEKFSGHALSLDENGALRVRLENGTIRHVHAGDVFFRDGGA